ncbi:glycosyltransferase [Lentisphaerota bacterium WC36G]|nr:glycosyltransferase [Lentisphaerae bacterium WC36]
MYDEHPKITVILPSYKHARWISEAIESVLKQTYKNFELIIVDDGSNDGSAELIASYAKKDDRIKEVIFPSNKGAVIAMRTAYEMSNAEYIALINSDDIWEHDKLEKQLQVFEENSNIDIVFSQASFIDENGNTVKHKSEFLPSSNLQSRAEWMNYFFTVSNCICHPSILIKRKCYEEQGFYSSVLRTLPDLDMWVRLFWHYDVFVSDECLIKFRKHLFNESHPSNFANLIRYRVEYKIILKNFIKQISNCKDLEDIFPEYKSIIKIKDDRLTPFYIAMIALKQEIDAFDDFAIDTLYEELAKEEILDLVEKHNLFSPVELSNLVASKNPYKLFVEDSALKIFMLFLKKVGKSLRSKLRFFRL